jgi:hypothetical protein
LVDVAENCLESGICWLPGGGFVSATFELEDGKLELAENTDGVVF